MDEAAAQRRAGAYLRGADGPAQLQFAARRIGADQVADRLAHEGGLPWTARWVLPVEETPHRTVVALRGPVTTLWSDGGTVGAIAASGEYAVCDATGRVIAAGAGRATAGLTVAGRHLLAAAEGGTGLRLWEAADGAPVELDHVDVRLDRLRVVDGRLLVGVEPTYYDHNDIASGGATRAWTVRGDPPRLHETEPETHPPAGTGQFTAGGDGVVRVWDTDPGPPPVPLATPLAAACTTLTDGRRVAVVAHDNGRVGVWDLDEGAPPDPVPHEFRSLSAVACARPPTGPPLAAVGCLDGTLHLVDLEPGPGAVARTIVMPVAGPLPGTGTYRPPGVPEPPPGPEPVRGVAAGIRADGSPVVVTVGDLGWLRWWCPRSGRQLAAVQLGRWGKGVACRDGVVVVAAADFAPRVYDLSTAHPLATLPAAGTTGPAAVDVLDGLVVALDGHGALHRLRPPEAAGDHDAPAGAAGGHDAPAGAAGGHGAPAGVSRGHYGEARTVACGRHPDGRAVAVTGGWDGTVRVWDLRTGAELHRIPVEHPVYTVALNDDGTIVAGWRGGMGVFRLHATTTRVA